MLNAMLTTCLAGQIMSTKNTRKPEQHSLSGLLEANPELAQLTCTCRTRAAFKYAVRACRTAVEQLKADARAKQLTDRKNTTNFWKGIAQDTCKKQLVLSIE